jgi:hypothetical protein
MAAYLLAENGKQLTGEFTLEQIKAKLDARELGATAHYYTAGMEGWRLLKELFPTHVNFLSPEEIRRLSAATTAWLKQEVAKVFPEKTQEFLREADAILELIDKPAEVRIALVGTTGAGKSTFLNALLCQEVLPVGVMEPCTAFVTTVRHAEGQGYRASIEFITPEEWAQDLDYLATTVEPAGGDDDGQDVTRQMIRAAKARIEAVFGQDALAVPGVDVRKLELPAEVKAVFAAKSRRDLAFDEAKPMLAEIRKLIRGESVLWPFVKQVDIIGPYPQLPRGVVLVDLPGLNDPNAARVEVTRDYLRRSPFVWVVFNMVRGITEDIQTVLRDEKVLRDLLIYGNYHALGLVGTQADLIQPAVADGLGLAPDCSDVDLVNAYRTQSTTKARQTLQNMVRDFAPAGSNPEHTEALAAKAGQVPVHMVSAIAYCKLKKVGRYRLDMQLDEGDTGLPGVLQHLEAIGQSEAVSYHERMAAKRLEALRREVVGFFRAQGVPAEVVQRLRSHVAEADRDFRQELTRHHDASTARMAAHREAFNQSLAGYLQDARQGVGEVVEVWRNIHWGSLRAATRKGGRHVTTRGKRINMGEDVVGPLMKMLPMVWDRFFTQDTRGVVRAYVDAVKFLCSGYGREVARILQAVLKSDRTRHYAEQVKWFEEKLALLSENTLRQVEVTVRERRTDMANRLIAAAHNELAPALIQAGLQAGSGMKQRMLDILEAQAKEVVQRTYASIQQDLIDGLLELEARIIRHLAEIRKEAEKQADIFADNCSVDTDEATNNPVLAKLLQSLPQ